MSNTVADESVIDNASVFRSFNPEINEKEIFEYGLATVSQNDNTNDKLYKIVGWTIDPLQNDWFIDTLHQDVLAYKDQCVADVPHQLAYGGDIIITKIDETVVDGASAAESYYLFDEFDMPPIDTWFYLTKGPKSRHLFAWIPREYRDYANEAIDVNCVDCIGWFSEWYPVEYKNLELKSKP